MRVELRKLMARYGYPNDLQKSALHLLLKHCNLIQTAVSEALRVAGVKFFHAFKNDSEYYFLMADAIEVEVKQSQSPLIPDKIFRAANVIAIQGKGAVEHYASLHRTIAELRAELDAMRKADAK
jgi:hypothetical protein